jgi:ABC-type transport system involved in multi-copper enzyme maturation permease subunit
MSGLFRAELLRLRKRRSLQIIVLGVPALVALIFVASYSSISELPPFDVDQVRAELIANGYGVGMPPEEAERMIQEGIAQQRAFYDMQLEQTKLARAAFVFPYSLATILQSGTLAFLGLLILAATITGDEFGWGTIRTTLLASSHRHRVLAVRLTALAITAVALFAVLLLIGAVLPALLGVANNPLPATLPAFDAGALAVLLVGLLLAGATVMAVTTLITLLARNGVLSLAAIPVYFAVEAAVLLLLLRFEPFGQDGDLAWILDGFPLRGLTWITDHVGRAATGLPGYPGDVVNRAYDAAALPIATYAVLAVILTALAFRRFSRMDIAE